MCIEIIPTESLNDTSYHQECLEQYDRMMQDEYDEIVYYDYLSDLLIPSITNINDKASRMPIEPR